MANLIGIDVGTSGCKAICINDKGEVLKTSSHEYPLDNPKPGWSEQNPNDWWIGVQKCMNEINTSADAIGLTGQMHGSVFLDKNGDVIRPALLWNDARTHVEVNEMLQVLSLEKFYEITCNPPLVGFQAPKILWLKNNEPENYKKIDKVLLPKDYIRYKLTHEFATDVSDASGTSLFDVPKRQWSKEIISASGFNEEWFPKCHESYEICAYTSEKVPVVAGGGDQSAGAVGTGAVSPETVSISLGTSGVVFCSQDNASYDEHGRTHTFCHANGRWHSMSVMLSCGGAIKWAKDIFQFENYEEMAAIASEISKTSVFFKPYLAGERTPYNNPHLKGTFHGLTLATTRAEIAKAIFEGLSFALLQGYEIVCKLSNKQPETVRVIGGGAKSEYWLKILSSLFQVPISKLRSDEGPAFGSAILAGVGIGVFKNVIEACKTTVKEIEHISPLPHLTENLLETYEKWGKLEPME